ncbi:MAG: ECF transporter S component [bacterium]|nr:ECF transporter S component [bacterium]MCM1374974.1 ECF transporter S component [Muribaculum sp.]
MKKNVKNLCLSAVCLALCMLLPFLTGQLPQIGNALSPMHIPVLMCGLLCGWPYGLVIGFIAPLLRFVLFGMPPLMPIGLAMMFELAAYGALSGLLLKFLPDKTAFLYTSLIGAMLGGRVIWGIARYILGLVVGPTFTLSAFLLGAFINAAPGIICHILLIPPVVIGVRRALKNCD